MYSHDYSKVNEYAQKIIKHRANSLLRKPGFRSGDFDDIVQDLITDLLERLPRFDPDKASIKTFITRIVDRRVILIEITRNRLGLMMTILILRDQNGVSTQILAQLRPRLNRFSILLIIRRFASTTTPHDV